MKVIVLPFETRGWLETVLSVTRQMGAKDGPAEKVEVLKSSIEDGHLRKASTSIEIQGTADLSLIRNFGNDHPPQMAAPDLNIRFTPGFGGF